MFDGILKTSFYPELYIKVQVWTRLFFIIDYIVYKTYYSLVKTFRITLNFSCRILNNGQKYFKI